MKIKVIAPFNLPGQAEDGCLELPEKSKVRDIFRIARAPVHSSLLPVSVNGKQASRSHELKDGDLIVIITPISGG